MSTRASPSIFQLPGRNRGSITDAMKSSEMSGTPRISSMYATHTAWIAGRFERRPSASRTASGNASAMQNVVVPAELFASPIYDRVRKTYARLADIVGGLPPFSLKLGKQSQEALTFEELRSAALTLAKSFLGAKGKRMLFEVHPLRAVNIKAFSAFTAEEELLIAPGTQLTVTSVKTEKDGLCTVKLKEVDKARMVTLIIINTALGI